jgi:hypothetical protein
MVIRLEGQLNELVTCNYLTSAYSQGIQWYTTTSAACCAAIMQR